MTPLLGSIMGVKIPRKTLDDMVMETIGDDPTLRREWAETRLQQIKRNGRSEMDIVEEGLDMLFKLNQELTKGAWPHVVNNAVVSGEARKTLIGLAGLWKDQTPTAEEDQIGPILGSGSPALHKWISLSVRVWKWSNLMRVGRSKGVGCQAQPGDGCLWWSWSRVEPYLERRMSVLVAN